MNRKLLTGLTLASVVGTGGAAYATVAGPADTTPSAASAGPVETAGETPTTAAATTTSAAATSTTAAVGRMISYQVGDAGTVTVDVAGSVITSRGLVPASGWNVGAMSSSGAHIDVQFANTERVVGFSADLVGADVVVSVTNDRLMGGPGPLDPFVVSVIGGSAAPATVPALATATSFDTVVPATPATPAPAPVTTPSPVAPPAASTSAPSSAGTFGDDDEYEDNEADHPSHSGESEDGDDD